MKLANYSRMGLLAASFVWLPFGAAWAEDVRGEAAHETRPPALSAKPDMRDSQAEAPRAETAADDVGILLEFDRLTERQQAVLKKLVGSKEYKQDECMQVETNAKRSASISCAKFDGAVLNALNKLEQNARNCPRLSYQVRVYRVSALACPTGCTPLKCPLINGFFQCCKKVGTRLEACAVP